MTNQEAFNLFCQAIVYASEQAESMPHGGLLRIASSGKNRTVTINNDNRKINQNELLAVMRQLNLI